MFVAPPPLLFGPASARLSVLLARLDHEQTFDERAEWLEDLAAWMFARGPGFARRQPSARLQLLLDVLEGAPAIGEAVRGLVADVLAGLRYGRLFTDTGLPGESSFAAESWARITRMVLPKVHIDHDAAALLIRLFCTHESGLWLGRLRPELRGRLFRAFSADHALEPALVDMRDAAVLIAIRAAAAGTADEMRERCAEKRLHRSPFLKLPRLVEAAIDGRASGSQAAARVAVDDAVQACRAVLQEVLSSLDQTGISLKLVYRLDYVRLLLDRLSALVSLRVAPPADGGGSPAVADGAPSPGLHFFLTLIEGGVRDHSVLELVRTNNTLLARRVIERAGRSGERYITKTRAELHHMVSSAAGGGAITALAVLVKIVIGRMHLPILLAAGAIGVTYATAFLWMQAGHYTLATKQPSVTAAALAHAMKESEDTTGVASLVEQVVRTMRSQHAALLGNLGLVVPTAAGLDLLHWVVWGQHTLDAAYVTELLAHHHPLSSGTMLFAALTGVYLWAASLLGGMVENWFVVRRVQDSIRTSRRLRAAMGREASARLGNWISENIAGIGGNVAFAAILALVPMLAGTVGVPIEVRHITFVAGLLTFAGMERGALHLLDADFLWALSSVGVVGLLNFGVSFTLALFVAFRARDVRVKDQVRLPTAVLKRFLRTPLDFIRAPRADG